MRKVVLEEIDHIEEGSHSSVGRDLFTDELDLFSEALSDEEALRTEDS